MEDRGYFIIDGSRLFSSIHEIWRTKPNFKDKKLKLDRLTQSLMRNWSLNIGATIRVVYYFKKQDKRLKTMLEIPDADIPASRDHFQVKECGESLKAIPEDELQKLSPEYRDYFARAEKGLDTKLTCDVLLLVASGKASNIVFLVNDRDYIPLFNAIQDLGGNVYLTALDGEQKIQKGLANLCDKYLTLNHELDHIFDIQPVKQPEQIQEEPVTQVETVPSETVQPVQTN